MTDEAQRAIVMVEGFKSGGPKPVVVAVHVGNTVIDGDGYAYLELSKEEANVLAEYIRSEAEQAEETAHE